MAGFEPTTSTTANSETCQVLLVENINWNLPQFYFRAQSLKDFLICFADGGDGSCELKDRLSLLRVRLQVSFSRQEVQLQSLDSASLEFESHWFSFSSQCPPLKPGQTWDLGFCSFSLSMQCHRPLGYCAPLLNLDLDFQEVSCISARS